MNFDTKKYLSEINLLADEDVDLAKAALALAAAGQGRLSVERYIHHITKLSGAVKEHHAAVIAGGGKDDADSRLTSLKEIIAEREGYTGDSEDRRNIENANLMRVIERRKGMPASLSIIYICVGRALGWNVAGIDFPGHFLSRIEKEGRRILFDPFDRCRILQASDLRALLKKMRGPGAEISASYFHPATNREILLRLQNNVKYRQIEMEDYAGALRTVESMRLIDPHEYRILLDAGVLYARAGRQSEAIKALEEYIKLAPRPEDRREAVILLRDIRDGGNGRGES